MAIAFVRCAICLHFGVRCDGAWVRQDIGVDGLVYICLRFLFLMRVGVTLRIVMFSVVVSLLLFESSLVLVSCFLSAVVRLVRRSLFVA